MWSSRCTDDSGSLVPPQPEAPPSASPPTGVTHGGLRGPRRRAGKHTHDGHDLSVIGGLSALGLDALSSVAYGPEAMVLVLVTAGAGALRYPPPLALLIRGLAVILVL